MDQPKRHYNLVYLMLCCTVAAFGGLLMGYDSSIISGAIEPLSQYFQLTPAETGWAVSNIQIASLVGCFVAPKLSDKLGRKKSLVITAILFAASVVGTSLAPSFFFFIVFRMIAGLAIGLASVISPIYLAELSPSKYRGRTTALYSICCVGGQSVVLLTNYFITNAIEHPQMVETGWRIILSSAIVPCILLLVFIAFIPESPRWNVFRGAHSQALKTLTRISNANHAQSVLTEIKQSLDSADVGKKNRFKLNKRTLPLLVIGIGLAVGNQLSGINVIQYFGPTLLKSVTGSNSNALLVTFLLSISQFVGVVIGMMLLDRVGRRKLLLLGALASAVFLAYSFFAFYLQFTGIAAVVGLFGFMLFFGITWGQIVWTVLGEIFPTDIRAMCVGISICMMSFSNFAISSVFPVLNSNPYLLEIFHGGFPLLLFSVFSLGMFFFTWRYVPETAGVSLEKIEDIVLRRFYGNKDVSTPPRPTPDRRQDNISSL